MPEFRAVVLGQLGEQRLDVAIAADVAGDAAHARALDADAVGPLRDIHRRVGAAILFESSGGQVDKVAHLPELRFALGEPEVETTTVDTAAAALEATGFFIRKVGTDGFRIHHQATLKKVVSDRRAALDEDTEIRPAIRKLVQQEFARGASLPIIPFPNDGAAIQDTPRLTLVVVDPETEWRADGKIVESVAQWTRERGTSPRLHPASLVWCARKPGRELRDRVELWLAWRRVEREMTEGLLGTEFDRADRQELRSMVKDAENAAKDEVWAGYRFVALADAKADSGLRIIDLGAGHSSANETLCGRVVTALKTEALLSETVGAGYLDRHWPPAFKESGAWPLTSLRQSFLNGSLTRLVDPDAVLSRRIVEFVEKGFFGLASGATADGGYERIWHGDAVGAEEVAFEPIMFLLTKARSEALRAPGVREGHASCVVDDKPDPVPNPMAEQRPEPHASEEVASVQLRLSGEVPPELWNRLGTKVVPKLRSGNGLAIGVEFSVEVAARMAASLESELRQTLAELNLGDQVKVERSRLRDAGG